VTLNIKGSHDTLTFNLHLNGYGDALVDLTPDQDGNFTAKLDKGGGGSAVRQTVPTKNPNTGSGGAVTRPDSGSGTSKPPDAGSASKPPDTGSGTKPPPPEDDCVDLPCVKKNVPGLHDGSGSGG
jgi:hypothetical protein